MQIVSPTGNLLCLTARVLHLFCFLLNLLYQIIVGFRKEQVNASLLTGKGEISDVQINVKVRTETKS